MRTRFVLFFSVLCMLFLASAGSSSSSGDELIVTLRDGESIARINKEHGTETVRSVRGRPIYLVRTNGDTERKLRSIRRDRGVQGVERNSRISLNAVSLSTVTAFLLDTDLRTHTSYLLDGTTRTNFYGTEVLWSYVNQPALKLVKADAARSVSTGAATLVAYIDTGVDTEHQALKPWLDPGIDLIRGESVSELHGLSTVTAFLLDTHTSYLLDQRFTFLLSGFASQFPSFFGHGTLVAGLIHVIAPNARIAPIKAFDAYGNTTTFTVIEGVYHAIGIGADVLNMSFTTPNKSEAFEMAINLARGSGMVIVASVGNDNRDAQNLYPAGFPGVYGVAATDLNDRRASFSNYGKSVAVTAPGAFVISTVPGNRYAAAFGTSFSAPIVSGGVALVVSARMQAQASGSVVVNTSDSIDHLNPGFEKRLGRGRVNTERALKQRN